MNPPRKHRLRPRCRKTPHSAGFTAVVETVGTLNFKVIQRSEFVHPAQVLDFYISKLKDTRSVPVVGQYSADAGTVVEVMWFHQPYRAAVDPDLIKIAETGRLGPFRPAATGHTLAVSPYIVFTPA